MTEKEIKAIETHTEIHAKAESFAFKITEILRKAVRELRENKHLEEEMEIMTNFCGACKKRHEEQLEQAKKIIKTLVDDLSMYPGNYQKELLEAEQFLKGEDIILEDAQVGNSPFDADEVFNKEMKAYPEEKVK